MIKIAFKNWDDVGGVMAKELDSGLKVSNIELQSGYYVHFQANSLGEGIQRLYLPSYTLNSFTAVFLRE